MQAVFLDEKTKFKKGTLLHWYEFTDPCSCMAILVYNGQDDPFIGLISTMKFQTLHTELKNQTLTSMASKSE